MLSSFMARHKLALRISQTGNLVHIIVTFDCVAPPTVFISCYLDGLLFLSLFCVCSIQLPFSPPTCFCSSIGLLSNICGIDPLLVNDS